MQLFAAGDWNFVQHPGDHIPTPNNHQISFRANFNYILDVCSMANMAGPDPYPRGWSYCYSRNSSHSYSHLNQIYCPTTSWSSTAPTSITTPWLDHCLVWAACSAISPTVQMAMPASRLPNPAKLDDIFWSATFKEYSALTDSPITLPSWMKFKKNILSLGSHSKSR